MLPVPDVPVSELTFCCEDTSDLVLCSSYPRMQCESLTVSKPELESPSM